MDFLQDTTTNDVKITNNDLTFVDGSLEVLQLLYQRLQTWRGGWFLNTSLGIPYKQEILVKNPRHAQGILRNEITNCPGVIQLLSFSLEINDAREGTVKFKVLADDGPIAGILPI